ncbi:putative gamma-tubulin complex component 5 [Triangularia verruculosa]|uniref:Spindle pole body component n=1 Tax=Triangularia verruculosa TaxID=2587418 RepID=A0AAN7B0F0_9PEZI|nr:putative gamma-tubulin complex component 5 [Triangularia verruculosa]
MAFLAQLGASTDELVDAIVGIPESDQETRIIFREAVLRLLRNHTYLRTNQFEVEDRLKGLEERFRVIGRDALADAFHKRLEALKPHHNKFTPDVFHFLLELADQPAQNTQLTALDELVEPEEIPPPNLTWKDVAREDGWIQERDIWLFNRHAPDSSDDEEAAEIKTVASVETLTSASSVDDRAQRTALDCAFKPQGGELLQQAKEALSWRRAPATNGQDQLVITTVSTLQLLREVLFMLSGLPTTAFDADCHPSPAYQLQGISLEASNALVNSFAECGRKIAPLRAFCKRKARSPLLQVFESSVQKALDSLDKRLASIQGRYVAIRGDTVVSLVGVLTELKPILNPLFSLSNIIRQLQEEKNTHAFRYLELLYDAAGMAQLQAHRDTYHLLGGIFFDCFQVYLKPIRLWMEEGKLLSGDRTFFVSESSTKLPLPQIWKGQFKLLHSPEGNLHAPRFLNPAIHRIFTAGKSIVVLKHMKRHAATSKYKATDEPRMDFATVCPDHLQFAPFSELFSAAFDAWIQSKHHTAAVTLQELLYNSYGLLQSLDMLEEVYLMSDGSKSDTLASAVFRHLDNFSSSWKDRFTLTEIAQEAFSASIDSYRIFAEIDPRNIVHSAIAGRSSVRVNLPAIRLGCRLNWPVQIVVTEEAIRGYQTIFTFLLQARRAIHVLKHPIKNFHPQGSLSATGPMARYYVLRTKLLWFCDAVVTYLTTLVLAPNTAKLRVDLGDAGDVDDMIKAHADFVSRILHESCQGAKLQPIRDCMLDIFDLAIKVADAQKLEMSRWEKDEHEIMRLSAISSPYASPAKAKAKYVAVTPKPRRRTDQDDESDKESQDLEWNLEQSIGDNEVKPHHVLLKKFLGDFERHLRFVAGGLRGVARASKEQAAVKWDLLAEMLEVGIKDL